MYQTSFNHFLLLLVTAGLVTYGGISANEELLYCAWVMFFLWDAGFYLADEIVDRGAERILEHIGQARTNLSWYIAAYSALIAFLAAHLKTGSSFLQLAKDSQLAPWLPVAPLVVASFAVMFIPIRRSLGDKRCDVPTPAVKSMFVVCVFLQKIAITSFVYCVVRLAWHLNEPS